MKRRSIVFNLLCTLLLAMGPALHADTAFAAPAKKAGKKKSKKGAEEKVPTSAEIAKSMEGVKWGMSKDDLQKKLIDGVKEKYRPLVSKTKDAVEEDRLRTAATDEMKRIRDSYVEFKGTSTGWDVSFLKGEFTHGNGESMIVQRDKNSQNFYFFIGGKLWKWYRELDSQTLDASSSTAALKRRFGAGKPQRERRDDSNEPYPGTTWSDETTRVTELRRGAETCLIYEDLRTLENLEKLRFHAQAAAKKSSESVIDLIMLNDAERKERGL